MAGSYVDVPNLRMPYDINGAAVFGWTANTGAITLANSTEMRNLNSESNSTSFTIPSASGQFYFGMIFPELRYLTHYFINFTVTPTEVQYSNDTTNGYDGTWTSYDQTTVYNYGTTSPNYRTNIQPLTIGSVNTTPVKAIRFSGSGGLVAKNMHIFGKIAADSDRVVVWNPSDHPTAPNQILDPAALDFGNSARESVKTKKFRVKNLSSNKTANMVAIVIDSPTVVSPTLESQYEVSPDGTTWYAGTVGFSIDTISFGQISNDIYVRQTVNASAPLGPHALRVKADPSSWVIA